ncbi:hypothetical protein [Maribacter hydrothermalis]|uniref:DUF4476 domain-containing protein n=1 Tax=Maribacter hydrothermalis TaxID=1836467 RepID=A0A1B7Z621_9FLAO|nr:hypothetical protein [Maribacter hydrothermalis]APQ18754.1 hypothetical protein BTR34_16145 [Maribacter hydrothermalis]OBR38155.1 hypothetical protein A9200_18085 [Maribacter hydrothermalis]
MKKIGLILLTILLNLNLSFSQTESEIDLLLNGISETENSKEIIKTEQAKKIIAFGENSLKTLAEFFTDSTLTKVKSECQERNLTKGEIAIIIADRIERMPYFIVTGVQNCTMEFCENNPNLIEYYLPWIEKDDGKSFKEKYINWLASYDRKSKSERRKEKRKLKKEKI